MAEIRGARRRRRRVDGASSGTARTLYAWSPGRRQNTQCERGIVARKCGDYGW
jgi:hypothetical protein